MEEFKKEQVIKVLMVADAMDNYGIELFSGLPQDLVYRTYRCACAAEMCGYEFLESVKGFLLKNHDEIVNKSDIVMSGDLRERFYESEYNKILEKR